MKTLSTKPIYIKNEDIYVISVDLLFPIKRNMDNIINFSILKSLIFKKNYYIRDENEFYKEKLDKMLKDNIYTIKLIDQEYIVYNFTVPKKGCLKDYDMESGFKLASEIIFNPAFDDGICDDEIYNDEINHYKYIQQRGLETLADITFEKCHSILDPNDEITYSFEHEGKLINSTTKESVYKYYLDSIKNNDFITVVTGDFDESDMDLLLNKYFHQEEKELEINTDFYKNFKLNVEPTYSFNHEFHQSILSMVYSVDNMNEDDFVYLVTIFNILNARENNLIHIKLRNEKNLVYNSSLSNLCKRGFFYVTAYFSDENYNEVRSSIIDVMESIKDRDLIKKCLDKQIEAISYELLRDEDNKYYETENLIDHLLGVKNRSDLYEDVKNLNIDKLMDMVNKLKLVTEIYFKGE